MKEIDKMLAGKLYIAKDETLSTLHQKAIAKLKEFNNESDTSKRDIIIRSLFKTVGKNCYIEPPLKMDYGINTSVGDNFYANFDLIILDVAEVTIGNNCFIGPRVSLFCAGHPISKDVRNRGLEYGRKITIGDDVWIGGNTVINPGVTIGSNVVIGSGSVVTKDIPSNVVACGNPCHVLRPITKEDYEYWHKLEEEYDQNC